jgi:sugar lactone lactonase YvrE
MMKNRFFLILLLHFAFVGFTYSQTIYTFCGSGTAAYSGDGGQATSATISSPCSIVFDTAGNLFIADFGNNRIRKINPSGIISTVAGNGNYSYNGDGIQATSAALNAKSVALDKAGNLYIGDFGNNRIRKVNSSGVISTIAGTGVAGFGGDGGPALSAQISGPVGLAFDTAGNLFFSDVFNNRIRKIDNAGGITTIAGNGTQGFAGDGGLATAAEIYESGGITFDTIGNLYFPDYHNYRIRKINLSGIISTVAGNGTSGLSGDGGLATAAELRPSDLTFDKAGNLYVADYGNNRIRKIDNSGIITTIAGGGSIYPGDGGPATSANLSGTSGVAIDKTGSTLYLSDYYYNLIQRVTLINGLTEYNNGDYSFLVYPNPTKDYLIIELNKSTESFLFTLTDILGQTVIQQKINTLKQSITLNNLSKGTYIYSITTKELTTVKTGKLFIE